MMRCTIEPIPPSCTAQRREASTNDAQQGTANLLYHAYELQRAWLNGASAWASIGAELLSNPYLPMGYIGLGPAASSALEVFAHAAAPRGKPAFGIETDHVVPGEQLGEQEGGQVLMGHRGDVPTKVHGVQSVGTDQDPL